MTDNSVHVDASKPPDHFEGAWQTCPCIILKTAVVPVEQLQWVHQASDNLREAILQARHLQEKKEQYRQASLECCREMLSRVWELDLPESERQRLSNRLIKIRTKIYKSKNPTERDLDKIGQFEGATSMSAQALYNYGGCSIRWETLLWSAPDLLSQGKEETGRRLAEFAQAANKNRCPLPPFYGLTESSPDGLALTNSDWKWLYKKSIHMTLKNGMSSESNVCVLGSINVEDEDDQCLSVEISGKEHRYIVMEKWALSALAQAFHVDHSLVVPSMNWSTCFHVLSQYGSPASQVVKLHDLGKLIERYQNARDPEELIPLAKRCAAAFESITGLPAQRHTKRHRFIFNVMRVDRGFANVGSDLAWQIDRIGRLLGGYLESFATNMLVQLTQPNGTVCLEEPEVATAAEQGLNSLCLEGNPHKCAFFYGIDFSIIADSIEAINRGDYSLILGDVNLFPGGLGMFSQCLELQAASLAKRSLSSLARGLTDLTRCQQLGILVDSEAWPTNSRWAMEVRAIQQAYEEVTNNPTLIIPFYPEIDDHLEILRESVSFGENSVDGLCWFLRDVFFSRASHFKSLVQQRSPIVNYPFFMYALENRSILDQIIRRMMQLHPDLKIQTRRQRRVRICDFVEHYDPFRAATGKQLEAILSLYKDIALELGEDIFIKPILGKSFCPIYVNLTSVPGLRTFLNFLRKCQKRGVQEVILEQMRPSMKEFWLEREGQRFSAELRCFYVRGQGNYA